MPDVFTNKNTGTFVEGLFFGQSSFAQISQVQESSVIPATTLLKDPSSDEELKLFAPFGCGLMTGSGSLLVANPTANTEVLIMGLGGVGIGA